MKLKTKIILFVLLILLLGGLYTFTPLGELLNMEKLMERRDELLTQVQMNLGLSVLIFVVVYIGVTAFSIPGATVMSLLGGFLFGPFLGVVLINVGATAGATAVFVAARYFLGQDVQKKYEKQLTRLNREMEKNGKSYFLTLRFIPLFPFFLINLLAGFTTLPLRTFIWTTSVGIIPGSFVYAYLGATGSRTGESGFGWQITLAFGLLALFSLIPVIIKKIKQPTKEANQ
jgi:uncharacterized membrane protein YdjX (TVP38/TMEM64 family)